MMTMIFTHSVILPCLSGWWWCRRNCANEIPTNRKQTKAEIDLCYSQFSEEAKNMRSTLDGGGDGTVGKKSPQTPNIRKLRHSQCEIKIRSNNNNNTKAKMFLLNATIDLDLEFWLNLPSVGH